MYDGTLKFSSWYDFCDTDIATFIILYVEKNDKQDQSQIFHQHMKTDNVIANGGVDAYLLMTCKYAQNKVFKNNAILAVGLKVHTQSVQPLT